MPDTVMGTENTPVNKKVSLCSHGTGMLSVGETDKEQIQLDD